MKLPKPKERDIQAQVIQYLKLAGCRVIRVNSGATVVGKRFIRFNSEAGCSDLIVCLPDGKFAAVEVKRPGNKATPEQISFIESIQRCNGYAWVVQSVEMVRELLHNHGYEPP